jgi:hypothetical protein
MGNGYRWKCSGDCLRVTASRPYGTLHPSKLYPRTASWAKFSRPFGTLILRICTQGCDLGGVQPSFRDSSSFEFVPRAASWAKFRRRCGTYRASCSHEHTLKARCWCEVTESPAVNPYLPRGNRNVVELRSIPAGSDGKHAMSVRRIGYIRKPLAID